MSDVTIQKVKVMADYDCFPIWWDQADKVGNIDPKNLPISSVLAADLERWADMFTAMLSRDDPRNSGFKTEQEYRDFDQAGALLTQRLAEELSGKYEVRYQAQQVDGARA